MDSGAGVPRRCVREGGMSLHADVAVPANDRRRPERLSRYVARPPLALDRLEAMADGRLAYRLKTAGETGRRMSSWSAVSFWSDWPRTRKLSLPPLRHVRTRSAITASWHRVQVGGAVSSHQRKARKSPSSMWITGRADPRRPRSNRPSAWGAVWAWKWVLVLSLAIEGLDRLNWQPAP